MEIGFEVVNDYYIQRGRIPKDIKNKIFFTSYEEAQAKVRENLWNGDISGDIIGKEEIYKINSEDTKMNYRKKYSYNVLKYQSGLEGFVINLGVIVWNKETKEIFYDFIAQDKLDSLIAIMPKLDFANTIIDIAKKHLDEYISEKDIPSLQEYVVTYGVNYPLEHNFKYQYNNLYFPSADSEDSEKLKIENVCKNIMDSHINKMFEERK